MNAFEFDQDEQSIYAALSALEVDDSRLQQRLLEQKEQNMKKQGHHARKPQRIAAAVALIAVVTVGAAFAVFGGFDWFMEKFNPDYQQLVEPVELSCQDQGIRMEIIAAQRYGGQAVVYLSLQDVSGENRLTENAEFFDGFSVSMGEPAERNVDNSEGRDVQVSVSSFGWSTNVLEFDEATNTLYLELVIHADLADDSTEITLGSFLIYFDGQSYEMPLGLSLENVQELEGQPYVDEQYTVSGGGIPEDETQMTKQVLPFGYLADMPYGSGEGLWISNIGMLEGKLHVQLASDSFHEEFSYGSPALSLRDANGEVIVDSYDFSFLIDAEGVLIDNGSSWENAVYRYYEFVFDVDADALQGTTLWVNGSYTTGVEGKWRVGTTLTGDAEQHYTWTGELVQGEYVIREISLSPLGLEFHGSCPEYDGETANWTVQAKIEGELVNFSAGGATFSDYYYQQWKTDEILTLTGDISIIINGTELPLTAGTQE